MDRKELLIMRNVRRLIKKKPANWILYKEVFGTGSTTAFKRCRELGLDPESTDLYPVIKSPSPPYTLEDGADTTTELVSGKSSGLIGGMQ